METLPRKLSSNGHKDDPAQDPDELRWEVRHPDKDGVKTDRHGRHYMTTPTEYDIVCDDCEFIIDGRNGLGNATQHHDRTGHQFTVWYWKKGTYFRNHSIIEGNGSDKGVPIEEVMHG